jgi:hypothetical protein
MWHNHEAAWVRIIPQVPLCVKQLSVLVANACDNHLIKRKGFFWFTILEFLVMIIVSIPSGPVLIMAAVCGRAESAHFIMGN